MPVQTRSQRKAQSASIPTKSTAKRVNKNKRKLTNKNIGTPPNKKKKREREKNKKLSPSKAIAADLSKLELCGDGKEEEEEEEEEENKINKNDIIKLQQKLLTQDIDNIICRENEYEIICTFIDNAISSNQGCSFYLCGSPGTGKTATMQNIRKKYNDKNKWIAINGMSINNPSLIYCILYQEIFETEKCLKPIDAKNKLEKLFINNNNDKKKANNSMYIVVIDEMDGLLTNNKQKVLYHLFGWTKQKNCKLILFGIANSIDLTDRFLPRLKQRNFEPELLIFKPYTKSELICIIKHRLSKDWNKYFNEIAINLCAQKVAKMYGDVRKCLEICRNALNLLLITNNNINIIGFIEMKQILSSSFESPLIDIIRNLPNHQKSILVISAIYNKKQNNNDNIIIYDKLHQFYQFISKKYILPKISSREFNIIIDSLITDNIIKIIKGKKNNKNKKKLLNDTKLQIMPTYNDIQFALQNDNVLSKFFENNIVIPPKFIIK